MIEFSVQVDGAQEVIARFNAMTEVLRVRLLSLFPELGAAVAEEAAAHAPKKSGKLARSIRAKLTDGAKGPTETIRPSRFYGLFQESGLDTMRRPRRERGIVGVRTKLLKSGGVMASPRRGFLKRGEGPSRSFHLPAHPFMRPAAAALHDRIVNSIADAAFEAAGVA